MTTLQKGDKAPVFSLRDQNGKKVSLRDFRGKMLLIYFYPRAMTPGCTKQAQSVRDSIKKLAELGIEAVGISPDPVERQKKFDEKNNLGFPLLSDHDYETAEAYGVWGEKKLFGETKKGIIRSSFLVDESGKIVKAWYQVKPLETVPNVLSALGK